MVKLGWPTLFDRWTWAACATAFSRPAVPAGAVAQPQAGRRLRSSCTLALLLPTALLGAPARCPRPARSSRCSPCCRTWCRRSRSWSASLGAFRDQRRGSSAADSASMPFYAVMAMPFTYRALDAGSGPSTCARWSTRRAASVRGGARRCSAGAASRTCASRLIGSSFLTATVVLGEFTIASLLLKRTLPIYLSRRPATARPQGGMALALLRFLGHRGAARPVHRRHPPARRRGPSTTASDSGRRTARCSTLAIEACARRSARRSRSSRWICELERGRAGQPARAERLRQDDRAADRRRLRGARRRDRARRRHRHHRHARPQAQHGHGLPELQPVPQPDRRRQRRVRPARAHGVRQDGAQPAGAARCSSWSSWQRVRRPLPAPAVGRPAAARRAGPRPGRSARRAAARRAALGPRRQGAADLLRDEIRRIQTELGITTLFVTHDQEEALASATASA